VNHRFLEDRKENLPEKSTQVRFLKIRFQISLLFEF